MVYRAEATFVGLGLWDLYSALVSPGARAFWDKQYDDAILLEDVNELTELWHFKTKPAWPVLYVQIFINFISPSLPLAFIPMANTSISDSGRDTVLLKTLYKSPTTIHVFSFSVDDPYLFPSLPPPDPSFIRAQVDLQGWAIEALSPSTTQLTLLEQSDPKGWSNKASTIPAQMVGAVAGVGDFVIKCGGPPVVTRLAGAKALEMRYDHEKGLFRVAYERSEGRRGSFNGVNGVSGSVAGATADTRASGEEGTTSSSSTATTTTTDVQTIECEIRCDLDTWASSLDIVVDPPPQSVTALRRHRLSSLGGGLWLTFTHDALYSSDERLLAIVRRGPMSSARDKGAVMVNGARVTVDVEELPEAEIKALSKRKRVKPARVPLDQPPVVSAIRRRRAEWDADGASVSDTSGENTVATSTPEPSKPSTPEPTESRVSSSVGAASWLTAPKIPSPLASFWSSAVEQATSTTQNAVAAISPASGGAITEAVAPSASKSPMQHAAEALHWLRELQTRPEEGWTLVSDKGFLVKRKLFPEISSLIHVHKGEKVIEGVSAEEVSSIIASYECRKTWDDRFASAIILEQFGARCHTAFVTSKGGFPFRDRGFLVASMLGRSRLPQPAALDRDVGVGNAANESGLSQETRIVLFHITTSFHPDSAASFSPAKYNPYAYPLGCVFIDGWVLETLDPYTKENYAIPSTRVTRIVAVDHAGSIPVTMNSMMNAGLARAVGAVEAYIKGTSPLPLVRLPVAGLVLSDHKGSGTTVEAAVPVGLGVSSATWRIRKRDEQRTLVSSRYDPGEKAYTSTIFLTMSTGGLSASTSSPRVDESASRSTKAAGASPSSAPDGQPSSRAEHPSSPPTSSDHRISSGSIGSFSSERIKPSSSAFTVKGELKHSTDLIVAEVVVDTKLYPEGYDVVITSTVREGTKPISLAPPSNAGANASGLPISTSIYTIPTSPLHSSGLTADRPSRHLLRLMLPTAQYQISTVQDPLTGETRGALPKPQWYLDLQEKGFVVRVDIRPLGENSGFNRTAVNGGDVTTRVDGIVVGVASEKESLTALGRDELQDDRVSRMLFLQR